MDTSLVFTLKAFAKSFSWSRLGAMGLLLAACVWAVTRLDWLLIGHHLSTASMPLVAGMAAAWAIGVFVRPIRMLILIRATLPVPWSLYWEVWSAEIIASAANCIAPMRAGDMLVPFILRRGLGTSASRLFPTMLVDRFFDFATVVVVFVSTLAVTPTVVPWASNATIALLAGLALLVTGLWLTIHKRKIWMVLIDRIQGRLHPWAGDGWAIKIHELLSGFRIVDSPRVVVPAMLLSLLFWGLTSLSYWLGAISIYPPTPLLAAAFTSAAVALSFIVPITPGGIGVFHAAMALALSLHGVPTEFALAIAIVVHVTVVGTLFALAIVALLIRRISVRSVVLMRDGET